MNNDMHVVRVQDSEAFDYLMAFFTKFSISKNPSGVARFLSIVCPIQVDNKHRSFSIRLVDLPLKMYSNENRWEEIMLNENREVYTTKNYQQVIYLDQFMQNSDDPGVLERTSNTVTCLSEHFTATAGYHTLEKLFDRVSLPLRSHIYDANAFIPINIQNLISTFRKNTDVVNKGPIIFSEFSTIVANELRSRTSKFGKTVYAVMSEDSFTALTHHREQKVYSIKGKDNDENPSSKAYFLFGNNVEALQIEKGSLFDLDFGEIFNSYNCIEGVFVSFNSVESNIPSAPCSNTGPLMTLYDEDNKNNKTIFIVDVLNKTGRFNEDGELSHNEYNTEAWANAKGGNDPFVKDDEIIQHYKDINGLDKSFVYNFTLCVKKGLGDSLVDLETLFDKFQGNLLIEKGSREPIFSSFFSFIYRIHRDDSFLKSKQTSSYVPMLTILCDKLAKSFGVFHKFKYSELSKNLHFEAIMLISAHFGSIDNLNFFSTYVGNDIDILMDNRGIFFSYANFLQEYDTFYSDSMYDDIQERISRIDEQSVQAKTVLNFALENYVLEIQKCKHLVVTTDPMSKFISIAFLLGRINMNGIPSIYHELKAIAPLNFAAVRCGIRTKSQKIGWVVPEGTYGTCITGYYSETTQTTLMNNTIEVKACGSICPVVYNKNACYIHHRAHTIAYVSGLGSEICDPSEFNIENDDCKKDVLIMMGGPSSFRFHHMSLSGKWVVMNNHSDTSTIPDDKNDVADFYSVLHGFAGHIDTQSPIFGTTGSEYQKNYTPYVSRETSKKEEF